MTANPGALVMAGGEGARMRRTAGLSVAKALVQVRGASLLERNLCSLLGAGLTEIWVACREEQRAIQREVARFADLVRPRGVNAQVLVEPIALGTIGAAALLGDRVGPLLTVNADNLCSLDLRAMLDCHARTGADLTLAAHTHSHQLDYGELCLEEDRVTAYREKPVRSVTVCSAISVLGPAALAAIDGPTGLPQLAERLIHAGQRVRAFRHEAAWIDVNDASDRARATALVAAAQDELEYWADPPDLEVVGAILLDGDRLLLERRSGPGAEALWDTPGGKLERGESPVAALARELREELLLEVRDPGPEIARFDAVDEGGRIVRHHVFSLRVSRPDVSPAEGQVLEWFGRHALPPTSARAVDRSLACLDVEARGRAVASRPRREP